MVRDPAYGLSAEVLEYTRQRYVETDDLQSTIAADIAVSRGTLHRVAKAQGWQLRKDRPPRGLSQALKLDIEATEAEDKASQVSKVEAPNTGPDSPPNAGSVADRLEAALEKELRKVESLRGESGPRGKRSIEAERIARIVERQHLPIRGRVEELALLKRSDDRLDTLTTVRLGG